MYFDFMSLIKKNKSLLELIFSLVYLGHWNKTGLVQLFVQFFQQWSYHFTFHVSKRKLGI